MKKKRLFRKLGSHESPVHSRRDALRIKRACEDYVRKLQFMHNRAVDHLQYKINSLTHKLKNDPMPDIPANRRKSACNDMMLDERFYGAIPRFVISCDRYPAMPVGSGTATYRFRIDYDCATPPFDRNVCHVIVDRIENILRFVSQGNY